MKQAIQDWKADKAENQMRMEVIQRQLYEQTKIIKKEA